MGSNLKDATPQTPSNLHLRPQGGKLELISYSDFEKKTISDKSSRDIVVINRFAKKVMHVTLWDGKKDVWTKR
jgi:hypothetical protein